MELAGLESDAQGSCFARCAGVYFSRSTRSQIVRSGSSLPAWSDTAGVVSSRRARDWPELETNHAFPSATFAVLAVTIVLTLVQGRPCRRCGSISGVDRDALGSGQLWRLATPLLIQYDPWWNGRACPGADRDRRDGRRARLRIGAVAGDLPAMWDHRTGVRLPMGACGRRCLGCRRRPSRRAWRLGAERVIAGAATGRNTAWLALAGGLALTALGDMHGPPLLLGFALSRRC